MKAKKKAAATDAAELIQAVRTRLFDITNLLHTVAKATREVDNDTEGSMQIACREIDAIIHDLNGFFEPQQAKP